MDPGFKIVNENPLKKTNFLSKLCFGWMIPFFYNTNKNGLKVTDIYENLECDKSDYLGDILEKNWEKELERCKKKGKDPSLLRAIFATFFWRYMISGVMIFIQFVVFKTFQPIVLSYLIRLFSNGQKDTTTINEMWISGSILVAITGITIFINHHSNAQQMFIGMRMRVAICSLVYRKILKLSKKSLGKTASGQIVNLLSNDVNRFDMVMIVLHHVWIAPFLIAVIMYFMYEEVQVAAFACIGSLLIFTLPFQLYLGKKTKVLRSSIASRTDFRVRLMNEIISGIQVIKMYAWEKPFEKLVKDSRINEIKKITVSSYIRGILLSSMVFVERSSLFFTVLCYVLMGNSITADKVFMISQYCNTLQLSLAIYLPAAISMGNETYVSLKRLKQFLILEEKEEVLVNVNKDEDGIKVEKINAAWDDEKTTLENFNLHIPKGSLCAVVGPIGSGKSSFLQLLLGELAQKSGKVTVNGEISYASQEAWLFGASVRNNILFGKEYDRKLYRQVVHVCALETDFKQLPYGDSTKVGERGVSLSGGQRARINLARAIYRNADIYLLDDPLSAVDTHVGKHLFEKCITNYLRGKTRILVTHQLQYLKNADLIVVLNNGCIEAKGTFEELSKTDFAFTKLLVSSDESTKDKDGENKEESERKGSKIERSASNLSNTSVDNGDPPDIVEEEVGMKKGSALWEYIKAGGGCMVLLLLILVFVTAQAACNGADYWVTFWTEQESLKSQENEVQVFISTLHNETNNNTNYHYYAMHELLRANFWDENGYLTTEAAVYVYTGLIVTAVVVTLLRSILFFKTCMKASKSLHSNMFHCLLQAPMRFFDTNPSGRILNRFSKDMGAIDEFLPRICIEAIQILLVMVGILVMIGISNPYMIIAMAVLAVLFLFFRKWYLNTVRLVKHIEGITKSPMFSHVSSSLNGISTIRACKREEILKKEFDHHQNGHTSSWFLIVTTMTSFGLWLDMFLTVFVAVITYSFILLNQYVDSVSGSLVGLAISQSLILTGMLQYGIRQTAEAINQMTSVERVLQYTQLDREGPFETPENKKPPNNWPSTGDLEFKHMSLTYIPNDPPVLKDLSLQVKPGEKIGIVGRTGAGKSSLINALFRLSTLDGDIILDKINTKDLGLTQLRKNISIIPQEPVLFSETLRYNLDPFNEYEDKVLWNALDEVKLKDKITRLEFMVEGGGTNFSLGERQLVCLARAIVRNNKVLILDEATANVDPKTDALIQSTIRRKFSSCTVLTIAHRLNTIMDSDRVLVLDAGRILEFDHPHLLLQNEQGVFTGMLMQTGPTMSQTLKNIAKESYEMKSEPIVNTKL